MMLHMICHPSYMGQSKGFCRFKKLLAKAAVHVHSRSCQISSGRKSSQNETWAFSEQDKSTRHACRLRSMSTARNQSRSRPWTIATQQADSTDKHTTQSNMLVAELAPSRCNITEHVRVSLAQAMVPDWPADTSLAVV